jgi:DNA-binding MarR family transcriptional regulator
VPDVAAAAAELSTQVVRLTRQVGALKTHLGARSRHGLEWSSFVVLLHLVSRGAMRANALAEVLCSDPSTISRQTASLVEAGLVERRPDPDDGRAVQLVATERGAEVLAAVRADRDALVAGVLSEWDVDDVRTLATLLDRFTTDLERHRPRLLQTFDTQETA